MALLPPVGLSRREVFAKASRPTHAYITETVEDGIEDIDKHTEQDKKRNTRAYFDQYGVNRRGKTNLIFIRDEMNAGTYRRSGRRGRSARYVTPDLRFSYDGAGHPMIGIGQKYLLGQTNERKENKCRQGVQKI